MNDHGFAVIAALDEIAKELNATPARVALAWLIAQPGVTLRLPARPAISNSMN